MVTLAINSPQSLDGFDAAIVAFKTSLQSASTLDDISQYMDRILAINSPQSLDGFDAAIVAFKTALLGLTADEFKYYFYEAMPMNWQHEFLKAGQTQSASTLDDISQYMDRIEELDPYDPKRSSSNNYNGNDTSATSNNNNNGYAYNRSSPTNYGNDTSATSNNNTYGIETSTTSTHNSNNGTATPRTERSNQHGTFAPRIQPTDTCPLPGHGRHTWNDCRSNRYGAHRDGPSNPTPDVTESHNTEAHHVHFYRNDPSLPA